MLVAKYCTPKFKKEAKEYHNNDYGTDILTDENGIGKDSPKSLKIVKDVKKANTYIVSYFTMVDSPSTSAETNTKVSFPVTVTIENGAAKISAVGKF